MSATEGDSTWARLDALFDELADRPHGEQAVRLEEVRAEDPGLAKRLEALLRYDRGQGEPLADAVHEAVGSMVKAEGPDRKGARIGPYRIVSELGHGGMGSVYLAERADGAYEAQVAIKLIRGGVASGEQVRRFLTERQILAGLDHPNIARLLDGGTTPDGLPYVVMEVIDGEPIDRYCDRERLSIEERIHLFRSVCDAVAYAHRNLVVHRDLKPANVLVTADGVPKLLDFGIAKLVEADGPDATRTVVAMTPAYASPEQVRGETVTTATDVYALGAILYELLTGHRAHRFETSSPAEIERVVCREGPDRPSTVVTRTITGSDGGSLSPDEVGGARRTDPARLRHTLSGDLDTIVLTALRKEPDRRYLSVAALSQDLANYLLGLPVSARDDTWSYRARKFAGRNRGPLFAAAAVATVLVSLVTFYTARLATERDRARTEATKAEALADYLGGIFTIEERNPAAGAAVTARELLDRGAETIGDVDDEQVRADLQYNLGLAYTNLGQFDRGAELLAAAEETTRRLWGPDGPETSAVRSALADALWERGEYQEADSVLQAALPGFDDHPEQYAATLASRGRAMLRLGRWEEAESVYVEALAMQDALPGDRRGSRAAILNQLGQIALDTDDRTRAVELLRESVAIERELEAEGAGSLAIGLQSLGSALVGARELDEAEPVLLEALALDESRLGPEHPGLSPVLSQLSALYRLKGEPGEALPYMERAIDIGRARGADHADLAYDLTNLAQVLLELDRLDEAEAAARESVRMSRATDGPDSPFLARAILTLGATFRSQERFGEATARFDAALDIAQAALPEGHSFTANIVMNRGQTFALAGDWPAAEADLLAAYEVYTAAYGPDDGRTRSIARGLARVYEDWGRQSDAERWREDAGG
ncbi:MAG: tetratricopeptide repeat protein [Gemmatimonadetes bacterium]|nr:tetratricopeptide repeat protein [Gemmatimonadota bacterium]